MYKYKKTKLNGKRIYSHRKVWTLANGEIPNGYVIHHINGDSKDNRLVNLAMMTKEAHHAMHDKDRIGNPSSLKKYYKTHDIWNKGLKYGKMEGFKKALRKRKENYAKLCSEYYERFKASGKTIAGFARDEGTNRNKVYWRIKKAGYKTRRTSTS